MQWNGDRNAGFSRADAATLYSPAITDPVYGYQAINVEAQRHTSTSLLNTMKRLIAVRKQYSVFGRGTIEFLRPRNEKVLAYTRGSEQHSILLVHNLASSAQPVELDLRRFRGAVPIEMLGRTRFPTIGETPYFLSLSPHASYWFRLDLKGTDHRPYYGIEDTAI